jgi:hypothetical protein
MRNMSTHITTPAGITDRKLAVQALKNAGLEFIEEGTKLTIRSGSANGTVINLATGEIVGHRVAVGLLRQHYAEATYRREAENAGIQIESRTVDRNGDIVLMCSRG